MPAPPDLTARSRSCRLTWPRLAVCRQTVETADCTGRAAGISGRPKVPQGPQRGDRGELVDRDFARANPTGLWVTDITEHPTREGKVYCAVVPGTFIRASWAGPSTHGPQASWPPTP